jgi:hypothetical protein
MVLIDYPKINFIVPIKLEELSLIFLIIINYHIAISDAPNVTIMEMA